MQSRVLFMSATHKQAAPLHRNTLTLLLHIRHIDARLISIYPQSYTSQYFYIILCISSTISIFFNIRCSCFTWCCIFLVLVETPNFSLQNIAMFRALCLRLINLEIQHFYSKYANCVLQVLKVTSVENSIRHETQIKCRRQSIPHENKKR